MRHYGKETDERIVRRVVAGDPDAFEQLIDRHSIHVWSVVARHVPADRIPEIAHETFVRAFLSLERYRPSHPFRNWLTSIALRRCADHWRQEYRERGVFVRPAREGTDEAPLPDRTDPQADREARRREDRDLLDWALGRLDRDDRLVLSMEYLEDLGIRECAQALGWTESKVKVRAHRARLRLKELLADHAPRTESLS